MRLLNIKSINQTYEHVYVSPHMDDVVFSCSGRIATQLSKGESVLIVTVFTGDVDEKKKPRDIAFAPLINTKKRRFEDSNAMERLGVDYIQLDYLDGIFRYKIPLFRYRLKFRAAGSDAVLSDTILRDIRKICTATDNKRLYLPLGVGQHVDHQILFQTGLCLNHWGNRDLEIVFYEEMPYVFFPNALKYRMRLIEIDMGSITSGNDLIQQKPILREIFDFYKTIVNVPSLKLNNPFTKPVVFFFLMLSIIFMKLLLRPRSGSLHRRKISPEIWDVSSAMKEKLDSILEYRSQLSGPFLNRESLRRSFARYSHAIGGSEGQYLERYWQLMKP